MRKVRYSQTFFNEFAELLDQGVDRFGLEVVNRKAAKVLDTVSNFLARHPVRPIDPKVGMCTDHVHGTPFVLLYDYDDTELRIHFVIHARADRTQFDPSSIEW